MEFRLACRADLPRLKAVYKKLIAHMDENDLRMWDEFYPCEFFEEDIEKGCLYVLTQQEELVSAFALYETSEGESAVGWRDSSAKAMYMGRLGVNVDFARQGIGAAMLRKAAALACEKGARYLRLFVVDFNAPAIQFYKKNGFYKAEGIYDQVIGDTLALREYGFEIETA